MKTSILLTVAVGAYSLACWQALAQSTASTLSEQTLRETDRRSGMYDQSGGGLNVMQLIHNANLRGNTTPEEFNRRQSESLDEAVEAFRKRRTTEVKLEFNRQP
ncbi:MAG: hypothetical protein ACK4QL_05045 [Pseudanabaenaceae cyanobacterium]